MAEKLPKEDGVGSTSSAETSEEGGRMLRDALGASVPVKRLG
jgi:hypothetical protein